MSALYAARKVSRDVGGQVVDTEDIDNYIGKKETTGLTLIKDFQDHFYQYKIPLVIGQKAEGIIPGEEHIIRTDNSKKYRTKTIIIASGTKKHRLGMKQEYVLTGKGVHYCTICDGYLYKGKAVLEITELALDALFIEIGLEVNCDFASKLLETNKNKEIVINKIIKPV